MKTNIVLIGLTGCGKTTVGRNLSQKLKMDFIDTDEDIIEHYGSIKSLFEKGEEYFRDIESLRVKILSQNSNKVISTGGGVVLRPFNMSALRNNGIVFYLIRPLEEIIATVDPTDRPLLKDGVGALVQLHKEREHLYLQYSDYVIKSSNIDQAASEIISIWNKKL